MNGMVDPIYSSATAELHPDDADIEAVLERIEGCVKDISLGFDRCDDPCARGPGLYFVVEGESRTEFTAPMGTRHMSALETSTRKEVVATITLSEEDGRVTVFTDGTFEDSPATSLVID